MRSDLVERDVQPALDADAIVVMERFVDSPLARLSAQPDAVAERVHTAVQAALIGTPDALPAQTNGPHRPRSP